MLAQFNASNRAPELNNDLDDTSVKPSELARKVRQFKFISFMLTVLDVQVANKTFSKACQSDVALIINLPDYFDRYHQALVYLMSNLGMYALERVEDLVLRQYRMKSTGDDDVFMRVVGGPKNGTIVDITNLKSVSKAARDFYSQVQNDNPRNISFALIVNSFYTRIIANFFFGLKNSRTEMRIFNEKDVAIEWVYQKLEIN